MLMTQYPGQTHQSAGRILSVQTYGAIAALPLVPLESVFGAYLADGIAAAASKREARQWLASHWHMSLVDEFRLCAKRAHPSVVQPSVIIDGVRIRAWEGFDGLLGEVWQDIGDHRGSMTLVVGAPGPSGKSTTARFLEMRMAREIDRLARGPRDAPLAEEARINGAIVGDRFRCEDIERAIRSANRTSQRPRTLLLDGYATADAPHCLNTNEMGQIATMARESGTHIIFIPSVYQRYSMDMMSRAVDRIVITAGADGRHREHAGALAPLVGMEKWMLDSILACMRPFGRLLFERRMRGHVGQDRFSPDNTIVSIMGGLSDFYPSALADPRAVGNAKQ